MGLFELFMIAVGLSMDAFAVSVSNGMVNRRLGRGKCLYIAATFGIYQGVMPCLGYLAGSTFSGAIRFLDHWVALLLLGAIGGKMIKDALAAGGVQEIPELFSYRQIQLQGVATSIDALAVGVSFALMGAHIGRACLFIAAVTFVCSLAGVRLGKKCGRLLKRRAELFGGIVLVLIGVKIFVEHTIH